MWRGYARWFAARLNDGEAAQPLDSLEDGLDAPSTRGDGGAAAPRPDSLEDGRHVLSARRNGGTEDSQSQSLEEGQATVRGEAAAPAQHIIFGGIEDVANSSSAEQSSIGSNSSHDGRRRPGPSRRDLARMERWSIERDAIEFAADRSDSSAARGSRGSGRARRSAAKAERPRQPSLSDVPASRLVAAGRCGSGPPSLADVPASRLVAAGRCGSGSGRRSWSDVSDDKLDGQPELKWKDGLPPEAEKVLGSVEVPPEAEMDELFTVGSVGHIEGECKKACIFWLKGICTKGVQCVFCHYHEQTMLHPKIKHRPCKGKRERYRMLVDQLSRQIEDDPDGFNFDAVQLPPSVQANETCRNKLAARLDRVAQEVRSSRSAPSAGAGSSSSSRPAPAHQEWRWQ